MKKLQLSSVASIKVPEILLLGIGACLVAINLTLISRTSQSDLFTSSMLFYLAIVVLIWIKRQELRLESDMVSSLFGAMFIILVLIRSLVISGYDPFLRIAPLISGFGLALFASGCLHLRQFWRELSILCFLAPSPGALAFLLDISKQTAQFATFLLWNLGFDASRQGVYVHLPGGSIEVYPGCSGIESMLHLVGLAALFLVMFPTTRFQKILIPTAALSIGFCVNGTRVALMAILAAYSSQKSLNYWHVGQGSLIFSLFSVLLLVVLCFYLLQQNDVDIKQSMQQ
ncbi:cyanoexosortase A [Lyngbya confervoides]|uniref:Cyanoexosortase A n=1 Tax=Lyngbya confervoides BDU141951 TaxID=1574623 RepID=A0ABD4T8I2_9CYAN|nr:cyanoexosortase A [Lyngbya confervoides]MCM1984892.1 cyanoexosortase A [Lyngbya confervoides BDU141951]